MSNHLIDEATEYLLARGKILGTDFTTENAVQVANGVAFDEEVKRQDGGEEIEFDGQNCNDCSGWTPGDQRCACGNRRVSWTAGYGHSFKTPEIYAEAY